MSYIIGVDIGTGSTKAVAVSSTADEILFTTQVAYPILQPQPNYSEQAPELIWQAFVKCIQRVVASQHATPAAICISSAMHSLLLVGRSGQPLYNMITWADARSASTANLIHQSSEAESLYRATGTPIHAMSPLCKIRWFRENEPQLFASTYKFISIKEFIWFKIFGDYEIDHSVASASGLFDIQTLTWYGPSLEIAGITEQHLSKPVSTSYARTDARPEALQQLSLSDKTVFVVGASDGCLANLGSGATMPGIASLTIGTSGAIRITSDVPRYNFRHMTFNYLLDEKTFVCGGPINNGGVILKWFIEHVLEVKLLSAEDYTNIFKLVDTVPAGSEGLLFLPYLLGERAPIWNSATCGSFFGIRATHSQKHFTRAVIEGICMTLYGVARSLEEASSLNIKHIIASGGFVRAHSWVQVMSDVFNKDIYIKNTDDASSIGAALLAIRVLEKSEAYPAYNSTEKPTIVKPGQHNHFQYQQLYPIFERLYLKLKDEMDNILKLQLSN